MRIVRQASTMRWWSARSLSTGAAYTKIFRCPTGKNPEDPNLASMQSMQWILLYLGIGHNMCYWELARHMENVPEHHYARSRFMLWEIIWDEISVVVACKPMRQNRRGYKIITKKVDNNWIGHDSILPAITHKVNVSGHMLIWTFSCFVCGTRVRRFSACFSYILYIHIVNPPQSCALHSWKMARLANLP
jgi:hypothetical protein